MALDSVAFRPMLEANTMQNCQAQLTHAHVLRAAIMGAREVWLPRRAVLLEWLDGFVERAGSSHYELSTEDMADLDALDGFLRKRKVPVA